MTGKVVEIFRSIQGEARYLGYPQVFVRFAGCNMSCRWCDSEYACNASEGQYGSYSARDLLEACSKIWNGAHSLSLTGGEPLLHADYMSEFLPLVRGRGWRIFLETNGTLPRIMQEISSLVDIVAMDIKLPSSTGCRAYWGEHAAFLDASRGKDVFIKAVITADTSEADMVRAYELIASHDPGMPFFLQPSHEDIVRGVMPRCEAFQTLGAGYLKDIRIIPQMHKFLGIR